MRVAVACDQEDVSPHFGRCERYLIAEVEDAQIRLLQWLDNPGHEPGLLPELMRQRGVEVVLAGGAGPRAQMLFEQAQIQLIIGVSGEALRALQAFASGNLVSGHSLCEHG